MVDGIFNWRPGEERKGYNDTHRVLKRSEQLTFAAAIRVFIV